MNENKIIIQIDGQEVSVENQVTRTFITEINSGGLNIAAQIMNGEKGKSAYQVWLDLGNTGTEGDFFLSLSQDAIDYVDGVMGDVAEAIDIINGEVI